MIPLLERVLSALGPEAGAEPRLLVRAGARGPDEAVVFLVWADPRQPTAVAKVARSPAARRRVAAEWRNLRALAAEASAPWSRALPRPLGFEQGDEGAALLQSWLPGRRLKDLAAGRQRDRAARQAALWLIDFHRAAPSRAAAGAPRGAAARSRIERYLRLFDVPAEEAGRLRSLEEEAYRLFPAGLPPAAVHGDFCDANLLVDRRGVAVLDWEGLDPAGLAGQDLFLLLLSLASPARDLGEGATFVRSFHRAFFRGGADGRRSRTLWRGYRSALDLPEAAAFPLFALSWVDAACRKAEELLAAGRSLDESFDRPALDHPLIRFDGGRCANVSLALRDRHAFILD